MINFSLINNLISAVGADDVELILEYLKRYDPQVEAYDAIVRDLVYKAMNYYRDFILPRKQYRRPNPAEAALLQQLREILAASASTDENELQSLPFEVARTSGMAPKDFFQLFYETVFGQARGPRFGTFVLLVGKEKAVSMLDAVCGK